MEKIRRARAIAWSVFILSLVGVFLAPRPWDLAAHLAWMGSIVTLLALRARVKVLSGVPQKPDRGVRFVAIVAISLGVIDGVVFAQGVFAMLLCLAGFLYYLPRAIGARPDPALFRLRMIKAAATVGAGAAAIIVIVASNFVAERRAREMVVAVETFKTKIGRYPEELDELVPLFLPAVPNARPVGMMNNFQYRAAQGEHVLIYTVVPPFGRKLYTFERQRWSALD